MTDLFFSSGAGTTVQDSSAFILNASLATSVGSNALTIALKTKSGTDATSGNPVNISFRNATSATGTYSAITVSGALSVVVSSGSTLGHVSAQTQYIYVYIINNAGTAELAISTALFDSGSIVSTTAEGGAGAADSANVMYSTSARSNVACKLIGRVAASEASAGTWATAPSEIALVPFAKAADQNEILVNTPNGHGAVNTTVRRFSVIQTNTGNAFTYADSSNSGTSITVNRSGLYYINYSDQNSGSTQTGSITVNGSALTTGASTITFAQGKRTFMSSTSNGVYNTSTVVFLTAGDVIRAQDGGANDLNDLNGMLHLIKLPGLG